MQLTHFTDFGLRVLLYLTGLPEGEVVTIKQIAEQFDVPQNHLNKIVSRLGKLGWVLAVPGRNGGLRLDIAPASLLLGDMLQTLEGHPSLIDCNKPACALQGNCNLKHIIDRGLRDFYHNMNRTSLADLVKSPTGEAISRMHFQR